MEDIDRYFKSFSLGSASYTVDGDRAVTDGTPVGFAGAAFVTGYGFLTDQAQRTGRILQGFGFQPSGPARHRRRCARCYHTRLLAMDSVTY